VEDQSGLPLEEIALLYDRFPFPMYPLSEKTRLTFVKIPTENVKDG
jgi:hypothetical protein